MFFWNSLAKNIPPQNFSPLVILSSTHLGTSVKGDEQRKMTLDCISWSSIITWASWLKEERGESDGWQAGGKKGEKGGKSERSEKEIPRKYLCQFVPLYQEYHLLDGLNNIYSTQFWMLSPSSTHWQVWCLVRAGFLAHTQLCSLWGHQKGSTHQRPQPNPITSQRSHLQHHHTGG